MSFCLGVLLSLSGGCDLGTKGQVDIRTKCFSEGNGYFYSKGTIMAERKSAGQIYRQYSKQIAAQGSALQQSVVETFGFEPTHAVSPPKLSPGEIAICARLDTIIDCMAQQTTTLEPAPLTEAPQQKRERGYWVKAVKQLHDQLKENGTLHLFDERIGSPSEMLELMHPLKLCTIDERDDRHIQKYVGNALEKYKDAVSERMLPRAERHQDRSTRGNISELAQNGMVEDRNRNGKAWDYTNSDSAQ